MNQEESGFSRRSVAVLVIDAVSFSRLMGQDETRTLAEFADLMRGIVLPAIWNGSGRVFKETGDGLLAEFADCRSAVESALRIQEQMAFKRHDAEASSRIRFRIGIHWCDVIDRGGDLFGDGVNLAARLESVAPTAGVAISRQVFESVPHCDELGFEFLGERLFKNIVRPVEVFVRRVQNDDILSEIGVEADTRRSIAVLPFGQGNSEVDTDQIVEGLADDIIAGLSAVPGLLVISRTSSMVVGSETRDINEAARRLGVRYILEGRARRAGERIRIVVSLCDTSTSGIVWTERYDREIGDIFALQDEIAGHVTSSLTRHLAPDLLGSIGHRQTPSFAAYELCVKARNLFSVSIEANAEAEFLLKRAIEADPTYCEAHWQLAMVHAFKWLQWGEPEDPHRSLALAAAERAVALAPGDSNAQWVLAYVLVNERRWDDAEACYRLALKLNPNNADALAPFCNFLVLTGRPEEAILFGRAALRLNPFPPPWYLWALGFALVASGNHDEAIEILTRDATYRSVTRRILAAALAMSGRHDLASDEVQLFLKSFPDWSVSKWLRSQPFRDRKDADFWEHAYRLAGFPA